jgi:integrase
MICLLTGARRGELCRVQWDYLSEDRKAFTLLRTKTENDIIVPVTPQIAAAIALARDALTRTDETSRIERLCRELDRNLLMSEDFVRYLNSPIFEIGPFRLRGFPRPQLVFGLPDA